MTIARPFLLASLFASLAAAQSNPYERMLSGYEAVMARMAVQAREITDQAASEMRSRQDWEPHIAQRRQEMIEMLGLEPMPPKTPLNVQITGVIDHGDYTIEKIAFESLPKVYVTANLYLPKNRPGPVPAILYVCGHGFSPHGAKTAYQRHGHTLAKHGYAALLIDPIQIAETFALHHGVLNSEMPEWYSTGYTPAGLEIWNMIRAMDYLETRPEIDAAKFGVTGRSGGAAMSWFSAAVDTRLKVVVPVMGISTYAANVADNTQELHCDCMFAINSRLQDMMHQGSLIAPRPLLMAHGAKDLLFPVRGYEEFERVVGGLYRSYGAGEEFRNIVVDTGHADSDYLRAESVKWFDQFLMKRPAREIDVSYDEIPPEQLAVFGGNPPPDAENYRVHEFFVHRQARGTYSTLKDWQTRRDELLGLLRERVFAALPKTAPSPKVRAGSLPEVSGFEALSFESEPGLEIQARYRQSPEHTGPAMLYVVSDGEDWDAIRDTLRQAANSRTNPLMVVYPRGVGEISWPKKMWKDAERNAMHIGQTIDSMRLWDVLVAAQVLRDKTSREDVVVAGIGTSGALGLYAGALDERVSQAILIHAPTTHEETPIFLNVLRYTDLPEAAALMAPRRVTFHGKIPPAYRFTQGIFSLHGKPDHMSLTMSLEAALNGRHHHNFSAGL